MQQVRRPYVVRSRSVARSSGGGRAKCRRRGVREAVWHEGVEAVCKFGQRSRYTCGPDMHATVRGCSAALSGIAVELVSVDSSTASVTPLAQYEVPKRPLGGKRTGCVRRPQRSAVGSAARAAASGDGPRCNSIRRSMRALLVISSSLPSESEDTDRGRGHRWV
ncbi:hypothetical protein BD311DRAFT_751835 [Dichomitus squalens]|uniref:Uncharacterized protein n=1 Tax=Dichomitus squalens TaxID=114155 RepID=A0A4Q9MZ78_9APHY|nr:hypothetical protein BD311DRAFT_751835 [Dichomitus squalens]